MKNLHLVPFLLGLCFVSQAFATALDSRLTHDGVTRTYRLYLPPAVGENTPLPLIIALHGRSGDGRRMQQLTQFDGRADKQGFVVVYPDGLNGQWNYLHGIEGAPPGADDVGFLLALVEHVADEYQVDRDRLYVTGISNGGFMAQRLACLATSPFAGFASVAAGGYGAMADSCAGDRPLNALYLHGTADRLVPWEGLNIEDPDGNRQRVALSLAQSVKFWARRNRCDAEVDVYEIEPAGRSPGTSVRVIASRECRGNSGVLLYAIIGGGHNWPGVAGFIPESVSGPVNLDIHASDVIWSFFARGRRGQ